jgi:hypothetical protein
LSFIFDIPMYASTLYEIAAASSTTSEAVIIFL